MIFGHKTEVFSRFSIFAFITCITLHSAVIVYLFPRLILKMRQTRILTVLIFFFALLVVNVLRHYFMITRMTPATPIALFNIFRPLYSAILTLFFRSK